MITGGGSKKCQKIDYVICERPLRRLAKVSQQFWVLAIGANGDKKTIGDIPFRWKFQPAHRHRTSPMEPFKWRHWSPMVIAIGANGDGVLHWRHYVHHHWSQWIAIGTISYRHWRNGENPKSLWHFCPDIYWIRSQEHLNIITSLSLNFLLSKRSPIEIIMLGHFEQISAWIFKVMLYNGSSVEITKYLFDRHERWRRS